MRGPTDKQALIATQAWIDDLYLAGNKVLLQQLATDKKQPVHIRVMARDNLECMTRHEERVRRR
jgi:hypothetical protein